MTENDDDLMDQLTERSFLSATAKRIGTKDRYLVTIPEGVEPGDLIIIEIGSQRKGPDYTCD